MDKNRVFHYILSKIGDSGKYQDICFIYWCLFLFTCGSTTYIIPFFFYQTDYTCPLDIDNCKQYVCSLPTSSRQAYISKDNKSFVDDFGDYRCDQSGYLYKIQSFIYLGGILGVILTTFLSQYFSKKKIGYFSIFLSIFGIILAILATDLFTASIGLLLLFAAKRIQTQIVPCSITETVSEEDIGKQFSIIYLFFSVGTALNGGIFLLIKSWKYVLIIYQLFPFLISLLSLLFYIQETPFDSIVNYSPEESFRAFERIAKINQSKNWDLSLQDIRKIKKDYQDNQKQKNKEVITVFDLFRYDSLRKITIVSIILHFLINYETCVPQLILNSYAIDIYWSGIILGTSEIISSFLSYFIINSFQRKKVLYVSQIIGFILSFLVVLFLSCNSLKQCGLSSMLLQISGIFFFRLIVTTAYNFFYMFQFEVFPTQIRAIALLATSVFNGFPFIITPLLQGLFQNLKSSMIITFSICCVLMIVLTPLIPQTFGIPAPEMIKELQYDCKNKEQANISE